MPSFLDYFYKSFWDFWIIICTPFVCSHLCPPNLIFLSLGQCISYKKSERIEVFYGRFCTGGFSPSQEQQLSSEWVLGGDGVRLSPFLWLLLMPTVYLTAPLVPESEMIGLCRTIWANSPTIWWMANVAGPKGHTLKVMTPWFSYWNFYFFLKFWLFRTLSGQCFD